MNFFSCTFCVQIILICKVASYESCQIIVVKEENTIFHLLTINPQTLNHVLDEGTNRYHTTSTELTVVIQPHCLSLAANSMYLSFLLIVASHFSKTRL